MQKRLAPFFVLLLLFLPACSSPQAAVSPFSLQELQTYAGQTAAVLQTETRRARKETTAVPSNTPAAIPTSTPLPTFTLTPTRTPTPVPCNWAYYVSDVTYPDYTKVAPSWTIEKTWRLMNIGRCSWTSGYQLIFDHGDRMDAPDGVTLTAGTVPPGYSVDATVILKTPAADGTYQGFFKLRSSEGLVFGIGADANTAFWIRVKVEKKVDLAAEFNNVHRCGDFYSTTFLLGDAGNVGLESVQVRLTDRSTGEQIGPTFISDSPFLPTTTSCLPGADGPIGPGSTWFLAVDFFPSMVLPPAGLQARALIKACTGEGLTGDCVERQVDFTYSAV